MVRQIISRVPPKFRNGRLWRVGLAAAALLASAVGVLTVSGTASGAPEHYDKQIVITMDPYNVNAFESVTVCGLNQHNLRACPKLTHHGEAVYYREDEYWFRGQVEVTAEPIDGSAALRRIFNVCDSQQGDWAYLMWWDPTASCDVPLLEELWHPEVEPFIVEETPIEEYLVNGE